MTSGRKNTQQKDNLKRLSVVGVFLITLAFSQSVLAEEVNRYAGGNATVGTWTNATYVEGRPNDSFADSSAPPANGDYIQGTTYGSTDLGTFISARVIYCFDFDVTAATPDDNVYFKYSPDNGTNWYTVKTYTLTATGWERDGFDAPNIDSWTDLSNTLVRVEYGVTGSADAGAQVHVDALFVQVSYSERYVPQDLSSTGLNILNFDGISADSDAAEDGEFTEAGSHYTFRNEDFDGLTELGPNNYVQVNNSPVIWLLEAGSNYTSGGNNFVKPSVATDADFTNDEYDKIHILAAVDDADTSNLTFTVTYSDLTTDTYTITVEDWDSQADNYARNVNDSYDQKVGLAFDYHHYWDTTTSTRSDKNIRSYLFHYTFDIDESKTLDKLTIPAEANLRVAAITLEKVPEYKWAYEYNAAVTDRWEYSLTGTSGGSDIETDGTYGNVVMTTTSSYVYQGSSSVKYHFTHASTAGNDYAWSLLGGDPDGDGTPPDSTTENDTGNKNVAPYNTVEFFVKGAGPDTEDVRIELKDYVGTTETATNNKVTPTKYFPKQEDGSDYDSTIVGAWRQVRIPFAAWGNWQNLSKENMRYVGFMVNEDAEPNGPVAFGNFTFYVDNLRFMHDGTKHFIYEDREKDTDGTWDVAVTGEGGSSSENLTVDTTTVYEGKDSLKIQITHVNGAGNYTYSLFACGGDNVAQEPTSWGDAFTGVDVRLYNQLEFWMKRDGTDNVYLDMEIKDTNDNSTTATATEIHDFAGVKSSDTNWVKVKIPFEQITWGSCDKSMLTYLGFKAESDYASFNSTIYFDKFQFTYDNSELRWIYEEDDDNGSWGWASSGTWDPSSAGEAISVSVDTTTVYEGSDAVKIISTHKGGGPASWVLFYAEDDRTGFDPDDATSADAPKDITPFDTIEFYIKGGSGNEDVMLEFKDYFSSTDDSESDENATNKVQLSDYVTVSTSWQKVSIPLSAWTWSNVDKARIRLFDFVWDSSIPEGNYTIYIDNVRFVNNNLSATAVSLTNFSAIGYFGKVKLNWKTEAEYKNAGFNIYRHEEGQEGYIKINDELIKGLNTTSLGGEYTFVDIEVEDGKTYWYLLEDVETTGKKTTHGPIVVHPGLDTDNDGMTDDWEYYYGLDPTVDDAGLDGDGDGLTNIEEFLAGTNPNIIDAEEAQTSQDAVKLTYLASGAVELELDTSQFTETQKTVEGITYQIITIPDYNHAQNDEVGKPLVPIKSILLGVEAKKDLKVELLEAQKESFSDYLLYPVERVILTTNANDDTIKQLTQEFYKDEGAYAQNAFYPGKLYDVDYSGYLRDQMIAKVIFYPIQFNPVSGELNFYKKIKLKVTLPEAAEKSVALNEKILPFSDRENYKIYIDEDGIYKITGADLQAAGIDLSQIDVNSVGIYHKSTQIPIKLVGLDDGYFDTSDYIEFYAQAIDTKYTGENVYWLNFTSTPLSITQSTGYEGDAPVSESFLKKVHFEENKLYWNWQEQMGEDHWFYSFILRAPGSKDVNFNIETIADINADATLKIALQGISYYGDEPPHHIYFHLNGNFIGEASWQGNDLYKAELNFGNLFLNEGVNTLRIELPGDTGWNYEKVMLDWIEVSYYSTYQATDDKIAFSHTQSEPVNFQLTGFSTDNITIFDITNPDNPKEISDYEVITEDTTYTISFKDSGMKDYIATSSFSLKTPKKIVMDEPSDLRSTQNKADYIIITAKEFYDTIQTFADYRTQKGLKVIVVKVQDIYDEFNYGIFDPQAIKDFLKYAYYNWKKPAPTYVLLVGDASFDYRNYYGFGDLNYVPTYMVSTTNFSETGSDNWFVCFDGEEDIAPEMLIGRFPVKTCEQLKIIIDKIKDYEALDVDMDWAKKVLLVADDNEEIFTDISDNLITYLTDKYTAEQLYLSHYMGSITDFKDELIGEINNGSLILNYTGHGANQLWADERILTNSDLSLLYNAPYLPLVTMYTCLSGYFIYPKYYESLGEEFLYKDGGGAVAVIAPSGLTLASSQQYLAEGIFRQFFLNKDAIVGSLFTQAKLYLLENASSDDAINVIQTYNLFGDPALSLKKETLPLIPTIATPKVYTTSTTTSSSGIVALTNISGGSDTKVQIDETSSLPSVKKTVAERAEKKEEVQEKIKLSRGTKGIIRNKAFSQVPEVRTEASLQESQGSGQTQRARKTEGTRGEQIVIKQKPSISRIRPRPAKEIIGTRNIRRLYKLVKQKNQKITILVNNYKNALKSKDYKEARFRIKLISRILKEKE
jgi:hypothetical protein